jgi:hypothetical protein
VQRPKLTIDSLNSVKQNPATTQTGECFDDVSKGVNNLAANLGADPNGADVTPADVAQLKAQHLGNGLVDVALVDNSSLARAISYFVDADTSPNFTSNPRTYTNGPVRNISMTLPNGTWYLQGYSQYANGGPPSKPVRFPTPILVTGSATQPLLDSEGSGTGRPGAAGQGAGKALTR